MNIEKIVAVADECYQDGIVEGYFYNVEAVGDSLAAFVVSELKSVHDETEDDKAQLRSAASAMQTAANELQAIADSLLNASRD